MYVPQRMPWIEEAQRAELERLLVPVELSVLSLLLMFGALCVDASLLSRCQPGGAEVGWRATEFLWLAE